MWIKIWISVLQWRCDWVFFYDSWRYMYFFRGLNTVINFLADNIFRLFSLKNIFSLIHISYFTWFSFWDPRNMIPHSITRPIVWMKLSLKRKRCDMAFIVPLHRYKPNITDIIETEMSNIEIFITGYSGGCKNYSFCFSQLRKLHTMMKFQSQCILPQGLLLSTWINFTPSMDK